MAKTTRLLLCLLTILPLGLTACSKGSSGSGSSDSFLLIGQGDPDPLGPDSDGDGLSNVLEQRGWLIVVDYGGYGVDSLQTQGVFSNPFDPDSDGDGVDDRTEFQLRLHPQNPDTDLDGLSDHDEIHVWQTKPASVDTDGDARGPSGDAAPEPRLFDGNEVRLLCDGSESGSALCTHLGTSPTLADTDGDGRTDYEELDHPSRSPLLAEMPSVDVEFVGEIDVRLNVEYAESLGSETQYGTSLSSSTSSSRTQSQTDSKSFTKQVTLGLEEDLSITGGVKIKAEATIGSSREHSWTTESTSAQESTEEYSEYQTDSRELTETTSSGSISIGVQLSNPTSLSFEVRNFALSLIQLEPAELDEEGVDAGFKTLGFLRAPFDSFVLSPGEATEPIPFTTTEVNVDVLKGFLARPETLILRPLDMNVVTEDGNGLDFLLETTETRTATVEIDFGEGRTLLHRVATNGRRSEDGGYQGLSINEVLEGALGLDHALSPDGRLVMVDGVVGCLPDTETCFPVWGVLLRSDRFTEEAPLASLEGIRLFAGDVLRLMYIRDSDGDGLADNLEVDTESDTDDSDGDGLTDLQEFTGWELPTGEVDEMGMPILRRVTSHLSLVDTDGDGLTDFEESPFFPVEGFGFNPTPSDPTSADTDGDGLLDGEDDFVLSPASVLYVDADATGTEDGLSWTTAFHSFQAALSDLNARNASPEDDEVSEIWVAEGLYEIGATSVQSNTQVNRARIYGGFQGDETRRGQRTTNPLLGNCVLTGARLVIRAEDSVLDGFVINGFSQQVFLAPAYAPGTTTHAGGHGEVRNCLFIDNADSNTRDAVNTLGALYVFGADDPSFTYDAVVEDCQFAGNEALSTSASADANSFLPAGGAITMRRVFPLVVRGCTFEGNRSGKYGGAIGVGHDGDAGELVLQTCIFARNEAWLSGGAVWAGRGSTVDISHCEFRNNVAWLSGGGLALWEADANVIDSVFVGNGADADLTDAAGLPTNPVNNLYGDVSHNDNDYRRFGGGIVNRAGNLNLVNSTLVNNWARTDASVFEFELDNTWGSGVAHLVQGRYLVTTRALGTTRITNSILWGNFGTARNGTTMSRYANLTKHQVLEGYSSNNFSNFPLNQSSYGSPEITVERCLIEDLAGPGILFGSAGPILRDDPRFARFDPVVPPEELDGVITGQPNLEDLDLSTDARLRGDSPAIDQGSNFVDVDLFRSGFQSPQLKSVDWYLGPVDLDGNPRFAGGTFSSTVDLGAYEVQNP